MKYRQTGEKCTNDFFCRSADYRAPKLKPANTWHVFWVGEKNGENYDCLDDYRRVLRIQGEDTASMVRNGYL